MEENPTLTESLVLAIQHLTWIEAGAVISGLIYVILAAREQITCWIFGIISSLLSIYLFYIGKLYAESILYVYYVIAGIYGWWAWKSRQEIQAYGLEKVKIHRWSLKQHGLAILSGIILSLCLAAILANFTDAQIPLLDSFTTVFSFIATYMVTRKILENWIYWIIIDLVTTGMYFYRSYHLYALLMIVYTVIAVIGYLEWLKRLKKAQTV